MTNFTKGLIFGVFIGAIGMLACIYVVGWWYNNSQYTKIEEIVVDSIPSDTQVYLGSYEENELYLGGYEKKILSFLGRPIVLNDSVCEQIATIAEQDKMLSYNDSIIQIGNVRWRINIMPKGIALMTSVQPDDSKMKQVVKYLNDIYGQPYDYEEDGVNIKWSSSDDSLDMFRPGSTLVHLRRVRSEEGGTLLFLN